jgi:digeranylgeranylglycerophospholipid reductase
LYPLPSGILENTFVAANFYSPKGAKFSVHLNQPVTCAVNRARFDAFLAENAQRAGAQFRLGHRVNSLLLEDGFVKGINVAHESSMRQVHSDLVVDAEGISSRLLRQAGLEAFRAKGLVYAVEAEIEGVADVEAHAVEVYLGQDYAPGFYGWLIPRLDGTAKLGLATIHGNPKLYLQALIRKHPVASKQLCKAKILSQAYHAITLGGPLKQAYTNGFLAVGDCASQVKPTTGGGVVFSITCANIAAQVAAEALECGDVSASALKSYQRQIDSTLAFDTRFMLRARKTINRFSDIKLERAISFAAKMNLSKALADVDEIDFQG